jgi:hypothetical protein
MRNLLNLLKTMFNSTHMYDNGGEENIKKFIDIIQEHYY